MQDSNVSVAYPTQYAAESANNDAKAFDLLNSIFPGVINQEHMQILLEVQQGISIIQGSTGTGEVLVHVKPGNINTEFRANFISSKGAS